MSMTGAYSSPEALTVLLATEGFMLAVISLAATLGQPGQSRSRKFVGLGAVGISWFAFLILCIAAVGSAFAWVDMYIGGSWQGLTPAVVATCVGLCAVAQPALAIFLVLGTRTT